MVRTVYFLKHCFNCKKEIQFLFFPRFSSRTAYSKVHITKDSRLKKVRLFFSSVYEKLKSWKKNLLWFNHGSNNSASRNHENKVFVLADWIRFNLWWKPDHFEKEDIAIKWISDFDLFPFMRETANFKIRM